MVTHERYVTFKSMSLRQLQPLSDGTLSDEALARTETLLAAVPSQATPTDPEAFRNDFRAAFDLDPCGASLIRPDGYVAWRSADMPADPAAALVAAMRQLVLPAR